MIKTGPDIQPQPQPGYRAWPPAGGASTRPSHMRRLPRAAAASRCGGTCPWPAGWSSPTRSRIRRRASPPIRARSAPVHRRWTGCWPGRDSWTPRPSRRSASGPSCWRGSPLAGGPSAACGSRMRSMNWPASSTCAGDTRPGGRPARHDRQQLGDRLTLDNQSLGPGTQPPRRDHVLVFARTGDVRGPGHSRRWHGGPSARELACRPRP